MKSLNNKKNQRGFSLIELMIVIAIIGILVGVGIPAYQAITRSANETAAIESLKTLAINERLYHKQHQGNAYGTFEQLITDVNLDKKFTRSPSRRRPAASPPFTPSTPTRSRARAWAPQGKTITTWTPTRTPSR